MGSPGSPTGRRVSQGRGAFGCQGGDCVRVGIRNTGMLGKSTKNHRPAEPDLVGEVNLLRQPSPFATVR